MNLKFTASIVGGPNDGGKLDYESRAESADETMQLERALELLSSGKTTFEFQGHRYKVTAFDKEKMEAVLVW